METQVLCPYDGFPMEYRGFEEGLDSLGVYVANTYLCLFCAYRLEKDPVYVGGEDTDDLL